MESSTPGFIAQLNGKPTNQCYRTSKISLGHHIDMTYVHLQRGLSSEETVEAKKVFEAYAPDLRCEDQSLSCRQRPICRQSLPTGSQARGQTITYCGVNAHFQNGKAKKRIRDLQEKTRKQLQHAKSRWPSAVELSLWPYALRQATHLRNCLPNKEDASLPLERFSKTSVAPKL